MYIVQDLSQTYTGLCIAAWMNEWISKFVHDHVIVKWDSNSGFSHFKAQSSSPCMMWSSSLGILQIESSAGKKNFCQQWKERRTDMGKIDECPLKKRIAHTNTCFILFVSFYFLVVDKIPKGSISNIKRDLGFWFAIGKIYIRSPFLLQNKQQFGKLPGLSVIGLFS